MRTVVPFDGRDPKTGLAPVLSAEQRRAFAVAMLRDVLAALEPTAAEPEVVATAPVSVDVPVVVDDRPLDPAVDDALEDAGPETPVAVVMADLALATPRVLDRLLGVDGDVVIAPGQGGGTNALVVRDPAFHVDYHGASFLDHLRIAHDIGATVREVDSMRLATDIDDPADLCELLLFGEGSAVEWLRKSGFDLTIDDSGVALRPPDDD